MRFLWTLHIPAGIRMQMAFLNLSEERPVATQRILANILR